MAIMPVRTRGKDQEKEKEKEKEMSRKSNQQRMADLVFAPNIPQK
jgi:hypothetical protein